MNNLMSVLPTALKTFVELYKVTYDIPVGYSPEAGLKLPRRYGNEEVELTAEEFIELHVAKNHPDLLCLGAGKLFAYYQLPMMF